MKSPLHRLIVFGVLSVVCAVSSAQIHVNAPQALNDRIATMGQKSSQPSSGSSTSQQPRAEQPVDRAKLQSQSISGQSQGYRIQVYASGSSDGQQNAQARAREIVAKFPQYRAYISCNAPTWRLRMGDFATQADADAAIKRLKDAFPKYAREMTIVRDKVNVWR